MKSVNISEYFPVQDDETMNRFLLKDHEYEDRKGQLFTILFNTVADTKKKFGIHVMKAIFSPNYILNHRWPTHR